MVALQQGFGLQTMVESAPLVTEFRARGAFGNIRGRAARHAAVCKSGSQQSMKPPGMRAGG
jgi:hypothetical protein